MKFQDMGLFFVLIFISIFCFLAGLYALLGLSFLWSHFKGAPFSPSKKKRIKTMLEFAEITPGKVVVDLGSGDGILVIKAGQLGANAFGVEINPFLVWYSRWRIKKLGLKNCKIILSDFYKYSLKNVDVVLVYLFPEAVKKLKKKFIEELKPNSLVISNGYSIPGWKPTREKNRVFLYKLDLMKERKKS